MGRFALEVRHDLEDAELERPVDFLPRGKSFAANRVRFPRQIVERQVVRIRGRLQLFELGVGGVRVLVPGEGIVQQRLPHPEVVGPRQPVRIGEELVEAIVGRNAPRAVAEQLFQFAAGGFVLQRLPFGLVVFFEEVPVADPAGLQAQLEVVGEHLAVLPEEPLAVRLFRHKVHAALPEVVEPLILNSIIVGQPRHLTGKAEQIGTIVREGAAVAEAALVQKVQLDVEIRSHGLVADAQQLVAAPMRQHLRAVDVVLLEPRAADIVRRVGQVGADDRPVEDRHRLDEQEIVRRGGQLFVVDRLQVRLRIDHRLAGDRIEHWRLEILKIDVARLKPIAGIAHPARSEEGVLGEKTVLGGLLHYVGVQPQQARVVGRLREHVGVQHRADVVRHVVVQPVGIDDSLALAELDVPLRVELQRRAIVLLGFTAQPELVVAGRPNHQTIGRDVDRAEVAQPFDRHPFDDHVDARFDHGDRFVAGRVGLTPSAELHRHVAAGRHANTPGSGRRHSHGGPRPRPRSREIGQSARRSCAGGRRRRCVLHLPHLALARVAHFRRACFHGAPIDRRKDVRLAGHCSSPHVNRRTAEKTPQPRAIGQPRRPGPSVQRDRHVAFQVRDDPALPLFNRGGVVDPEHGLAAAGRRFALLDRAIAAQNPNLEGAGLPVVARLSSDADRLGGVQRRQLHLGGGGSGEEKLQIAKCKLKNAKCSRQFAFCNLHFAICILPSARGLSAAAQRRRCTPTAGQ